MNIDERLNQILTPELPSDYLCFECNKNYAETKKEIKQLFQELINEVVGEDDELGADGLRKSDGGHINNFKYEQRKKAKELLEKM